MAIIESYSGYYPPERQQMTDPETEIKMTVFETGIKEWKLNGKLHRLDGPAIERPDGSRMWYLNDVYHRTDGPAIEYANGGEEWWINGLRHREDGPAIDRVDGDRQWYINGERHRTDGPAWENPHPGLGGYYLHGNRVPYNVWKSRCRPFIIRHINTSSTTYKPKIFIL